MDTDVLVYLQKIKTFLNNNQEAMNYFIGNSDVDEFYRQLSIISNKNYETNGQPELTKEQLEALRTTMIVLSIKNQRVFYSDDKLFLFLDDLFYEPIRLTGWEIAKEKTK
jgi:hypothetical protein